MNTRTIITAALLALFIIISTPTRSSAASVALIHGNGFILTGTTPFDETAGWEFSSRPTPTFNSIRVWSFSISRPGSFDNWSIALGAPADQNRLTAGLYTGVTDISQVAQGPTLTFSGNGRGVTTHDGWFRIWEITYSLDFTRVESVAFDFEQGRPGSPVTITGSWRYNSNIPLSPVPEPTTAAIMLLTLSGATLRRRKQ